MAMEESKDTKMKSLFLKKSLSLTPMLKSMQRMKKMQEGSSKMETINTMMYLTSQMDMNLSMLERKQNENTLSRVDRGST